MEPEEQFVANIAKVCHEANKAYCQTIGDYSQFSWEDAPEWQKESAIKGVQYRLLHAGESPIMQHEKWMQEKIADGWIYGTEKDSEKKTHPSLVEWGDLPYDIKLKDILFCNIVDALN